MANFPHETLPTEQLTLEAFTALMHESASRSPMEYINTALCGRIFVDGVPHRVSLNARQGLDHPISPELTRDFDSAIGITDDLPYTSPFNVYPISSFRDTLTKPNHVQGRIYLPDVRPSSHLLSSAFAHHLSVLSYHSGEKNSRPSQQNPKLRLGYRRQ